MYDLVGGGFHRYSVDEQWLVPHFEKMLYDNALLIPAYLHALARDRRGALPRASSSRRVEYALRELRLEGGGFASAQDADTDGVEGLTFTWTPEEIDRARSCCSRSSTAAPSCAASSRRRARAAARDRASSGRSRCATTRRSPRGTGSCSPRSPKRARRLERDDWLDAARELAEFLLGPLSDGERLHRTWRDGVAKGTGYLEDYANVAHGLYELHVATGELRWLHESHRLALLAIELFADDEHGGFFLTPADGEALVARQKDLDDNPTPSGNSMLAFVLLRLARIWGDDELERRAVGVLRLVRDVIARAPQGFGWALVRARPPPLAAARARDRRRPSKRGRAGRARAVRPERRRRLRPGGRRPAARGQDARRRETGRLRLRALRLPGAGHGSGPSCR